MPVGDVRVLTLAEASSGLQIPASLPNAQYEVILGNTNVASATIPTFTVRGDWMTSQVAGPLASLAPPASATDGAPLPAMAYPMSRGTRFEAALRNFERTGLPSPAVAHAARFGTGAAADVLVPSRATAPPVGTTLQIKVLTPAGFNGTGSINCSAGGYTTTTGVVRAVGVHALVVGDVNNPSGGFTTADYQSVADQFDSVTYQVDTEYFGLPTDLDANGHIIIYYTTAVNKLTPAGESTTSGYVGGFFFAGDLYDPVAGSKGCLSSNKAEIFYLLAPDPSGTLGNRFSAAFVRQVTSGTVAHEFQHMINSGNRYVRGYNFESTWMDEGLAHLAEDVVGRAKAGYPDFFTVTGADIDRLNQTQPDVVQAYFLQNFARAKYYVQRPDTTGPIVSNAKSAANLASRGAEWAFLRYLDDWYSGSDAHRLTKQLAAGPDTGTVNVTRSTGAPLDTLLARWLVTLYADHTGISGLDPVYNYKSYNFRELISTTLVGVQSGASYLPEKAIGAGKAVISATVPGSSGNYFVTSLSTGGARTISITNSGGSPATDPNGRVYVLRRR